MKPVAYYLRTSSAANLHGDSRTRQEAAIRAYAIQCGLNLVQGFWDQAVSGADPISDREGLTLLIDFCKQQNISTVLVENASRFARNVTVQELGFLHLQSLGISIIPVDSPDYFLNVDDDPTRKAIRQMLGVMNELDKDQTVKKLRSGRIQKRKTSKEPTLSGSPKCEGRKSLWQLFPELPRLAKKIRDTDRCGLRQVAIKLHQLGYTSPTRSGEALSRPAIRRLLSVAERQEQRILPRRPKLPP